MPIFYRPIIEYACQTLGAYLMPRRHLSFFPASTLTRVLCRRTCISEETRSSPHPSFISPASLHTPPAMDFPEVLPTNPCKAWERLKDSMKVETVVPISHRSPQPKNVVRFVCISDTHNHHDELQHAVPGGDVLLHAGDFTRKGSLAEASTFNTWLGTLPHRHKIVIAGNHEKIFDHDSNPDARPGTEVITNATYLQDSSTTVCGLKVYGSPWTPEYHVTAFNLPRGDALKRRWAKIPEDLDILMTHGPPLGYGDLNHRGIRSGCIDLLRAVKTRVKPRFHVYGHIHEGFSMTTDGYTTFVNASTCNRPYKPVNPAMVFDVPLPPGATKDK